MSAVKVIRALLAADAAVIAICPAAKIGAGFVPQDTAMPALLVQHIGTVPIARIDAQAEYGLVTSRIQVTAMAGDYPGVKALLAVVRKACNYERGTIATVSVVSVLRDTVGPDLTNDDASIYYQSMDFKVTYHEQN
jgi:hypothetical protein